MKIAIIDNYDSFTYNLHQLVSECGCDVEVHRNDQFRMSDLESADKILLSPGPGVPEEAGLLLETIRTFASRKPILGVCLGHQAISQVFGAQLENLATVFHGIQSEISIDAPDYLFDGLDTPVKVGRYHSWVVCCDGFPACLEVTATSAEGHIMALRHRQWDVRGIQFHPESVLTPQGKQIIENWIHHRADA